MNAKEDKRIRKEMAYPFKTYKEALAFREKLKETNLLFK